MEAFDVAVLNGPSGLNIVRARCAAPRTMPGDDGSLVRAVVLRPASTCCNAATIAAVSLCLLIGILLSLILQTKSW